MLDPLSTLAFWFLVIVVFAFLAFLGVISVRFFRSPAVLEFFSCSRDRTGGRGVPFRAMLLPLSICLLLMWCTAWTGAALLTVNGALVADTHVGLWAWLGGAASLLLVGLVTYLGAAILLVTKQKAV